MSREWKIAIGIATVVIMPCIVCLCILPIVNFYYYRNTTSNNVEGLACPPLPKGFSKSQLVGTWVGHYFDNTDKLIIRDDGTYKQIYSGDYVSFESEWQNWYTEYDKKGYLRLHLIGMRRCDGLDSECNDPGGGLPNDSKAVNPCSPESLTFDNEVILFVTGTKSDLPLGIMLQQATLAGSDWTYTFRLEK